MLRKSNFKLVNGNQLFDLSKDPGEKINIAEENTRIVEEMKSDAKILFEDLSKTRDFSPTPNQFGKLTNKPISLSPINDMTTNGFYLRILDEIPFRVTIEQVQQQLFPSGTYLQLNFGKQRFRKPITTTATEITFGEIILPAGDYFMKVESDHQKMPKEWHFGLDDPGFRSVIISKE